MNWLSRASQKGSQLPWWWMPCLYFKQFDFQTAISSSIRIFEHIWVDIRVNDKIYSLNTLYRPPNESNESHALFLSESEKILSSMSAHNADNFILAADLNFGNSSYCTYPVLSPKPLDDKAPVLFSSFGYNRYSNQGHRFNQGRHILSDRSDIL